MVAPLENDMTKSSRILAEIEKRRERAIRAAEEIAESVKLVFFTLLEERYAFFGSEIKEILPMTRINRIPGSPDHILGVINVRGDIESVLDLNKVLGLPEQPRTIQNRILIAESEGYRSGILAGSVEDILDVPTSSIHQPIMTLADNVKEFVAGETVYLGNEVTALNIGKILKKTLAG